MFTTAIGLLCLSVGNPAEAGYRPSRELALDACQAMSFEGWNLVAQDAQDLEARLKAHPEDTDARAVLIGYYAHVKQAAEARGANPDLVRHLAWVVGHQPWAGIAGMETIRIFRFQSAESWASLKALWLEAIRSHRNDARVLGNAAHFLRMENDRLAAELLERAVSLEPDDPYWHKELASAWKTLAGKEGGDARRALWVRALGEIEKAWTLQRGARKSLLLDDSAEAAIEAGALARARDRANEILADGTLSPGSLQVYRARIVLARAALASGDLVVMRDALHKAGEGAAEAVRFSTPSMALIEDLLARGAKDDALDYIKRCEPLWPDHVEKLRDWSALIRQGQDPATSSWYVPVRPAGASSATTSN